MKIIAVQKDDDGNIMNVKTDNQEVLTLEQAIYQASQGLIDGVNVGKTKTGKSTLKGVADGDPNNNLSNLQIF